MRPWPYIDAPRADEAGSWLDFKLFVTPGNVVDFKNRIEAKAASLRNDVASCTKLSQGDRAGFAAWDLAWRKFFCLNDTGTCTAPDTDLWGLGGQYDACTVWETQLFDWQTKIAAQCPVSAPIVKPATATADSASVARSAAVVLAILAGVYVISKTGLPEIWPRKTRKR